jgi:hypothetical protein
MLMSQVTPPSPVCSQDLRDAFDRVGGAPEIELRTLPARRVVGVAFSQVAFLLVVGGLWLGLGALALGQLAMAALGFAVLGLGILIGWNVGRLCGERLLVCPGGVVRQRGRRVDCLRWSDLQEVIANEHDRSLVLVRKEGDPWTLNGLDVERVEQLRRAADSPDLPWKSP